MWLVSCGAFLFFGCGDCDVRLCSLTSSYPPENGIRLCEDRSKATLRWNSGAGTALKYGGNILWVRNFCLTFTNIYSIIQAGWNTAIEYLCSRFAYAEPMMVYHWDCPSTVRGLPSDRRNSACVVGILRCFCFIPNWENEYWRCETVQLDKCIPARKWDTTLWG